MLWFPGEQVKRRYVMISAHQELFFRFIIVIFYISVRNHLETFCILLHIYAFVIIIYFLLCVILLLDSNVNNILFTITYRIFFH